MGRCLAGLLLAVALPLRIAAPADDVADFLPRQADSTSWRYGTGGGYDLYARMLGRFMGDISRASPPSLRRTCPAPAAAGRQLSQ